MKECLKIIGEFSKTNHKYLIVYLKELKKKRNCYKYLNVDALDHITKTYATMHGTQFKNKLEAMRKDENLIETEHKQAKTLLSPIIVKLMSDETTQNAQFMEVLKDLVDDIKQLQKNTSYNVSDTDSTDSNDDNDDKNDKMFFKTYKFLMTTFGSERRITTAIGLCTSDINKDDFLSDYLNMNIDLIGFNNGVYDLIKHTFRPLEANDYVSFSVKYDYIEEDLNNEEEKLENIAMQDFLNKVITDKDIREFFIGCVALSLKGANINQFLTILYGQGSNGKSKLFELINQAFGDYYGVMDANLLTDCRKDANAHQSNLYSVLKCRLAVVNEPSTASHLNAEVVKQLTGNDYMQIRQLGVKATKKVKLLATIMVLCNNMPVINETTPAMIRRIRKILMDSNFVEKKEFEEYEDMKKKEKEQNKQKENTQEVNNEKVFQLDKEIDKKFDKWKLLFMRLLLKKLKELYKNNKLEFTTPDEVLEASKAMVEGNNPIIEWIDNWLINDPKGLVSLSEIKNHFAAHIDEDERKCEDALKEFKYQQKGTPNKYWFNALIKPIETKTKAKYFEGQKRYTIGAKSENKRSMFLGIRIMTEAEKEKKKADDAKPKEA